ncbi:MAG: beta-N-acetylhexosaminidase [Clostridia bacterium]|nr:beta-N-acetylhexosaminidase [Clostridia bacterium]
MRDKKRFGAMLDMSRNAVMKPEQVKKYARILSGFGYNTLLLYTEDTYEVKNEPYFGLMRGRYTQAELRDIDGYCTSLGIELIPCIQTLAHLESIFVWAVYHDHAHDTADVLLADAKRTYVLIENMFATISETFTSKTVHIGMDEAFMLGLGEFKRRYGEQDAFEVFNRHLYKVLSLAEKYGLNPIMWSDMIFRLTSGEDFGTLNGQTPEIPQEQAKQIPQNVGLVYWDYYRKEEGGYAERIRNHRALGNEVWFAGGALSWFGFSSANAATLTYMAPAMRACRKQQVDNVMLTLWGDNGKECSYYALLPSLCAVKCIYDGEERESVWKEKFLKVMGESFDDFMALDIPNFVGGNDYALLNMGKAMFYADPFLGYFDTTVVESVPEEYAQAAKKYRLAAQSSGYAYLFEYLAALCDFLNVKYDLGWRTYLAYQAKNREALVKATADYQTALDRLDAFFDRFRKVWFTENKPHGFEVQEQRIGGLMLRLKSCKRRLNEYLNSEIDTIPELEEKRLDYYGNEEREFVKKAPWSYHWSRTVTPNVM